MEKNHEYYKIAASYRVASDSYRVCSMWYEITATKLRALSY